MMTILLISGGLVVFLLMIGGVLSIGSQRSLVDERLSPYIREEKSSKSKDKSTFVGDWVNKQVERSISSGIGRELARRISVSKPGVYRSDGNCRDGRWFLERSSGKEHVFD
jgi:hypothetical protein